MTRWDLIAEHIGAATGESFQVRRQRPVGGGCINRAAVVEDGGRAFFVKLNTPERLDMFEAESEGLAALAAARAIRVPEPVCVGLAGDESFLVMERLDLGGRLDGERAGRQLAELHRATAERFGWHRDNTIGSTPQLNAAHPDWVAAWPLDPVYAVRRILYNLYHVLNHLNLFGGGYLQQSRSMIEHLLAETA